MAEKGPIISSDIQVVSATSVYIGFLQRKPTLTILRDLETRCSQQPFIYPELFFSNNFRDIEVSYRLPTHKRGRIYRIFFPDPYVF